LETADKREEGREKIERRKFRILSSVFFFPSYPSRLLAIGLVGNSITKADRKITIGFFQPK
jgi:hypothetical protein